MVPELKYLQARGISVSTKKREELVELAENTHELALESSVVKPKPK